MRQTRKAWTIAVSSLVLVGPAAALAQQQVRVMATSRIGGPGGEKRSTISRRSLERYAKILGLTQDQKEAATTLHEAYAAAVRQADKELGESLHALQRQSEEEDAREEFMKQLPELMKKRQAATSKAEASFFGDLKSLADTSQQERWGKVERTRRREVGLRGGVVSGAGVDLVEVLDEMKSEGGDAGLAEAIEQYEQDLDRELGERDRSKPDADFTLGPEIALEMSKLEGAMAKQREGDVKIRDLNERHARKIEGLLPEAERPKFAQAVRAATFPRIYRASKVEKDIDAALKLTDLSAEQRAQLQTLREGHAKEAGPLNDRWSAAQRTADEKGGGGLIASPGMQAIVRFDDGDEDSALKDARTARKDLDARTREKLKQALSPAQREKLPSETDKGSDGEEGMEHMMGVFETESATVRRSK